MEIAELNQTIKEKQQEIFDLMKEMERKELEFKKREEELLATIKEREREIDQLKTEMKSRSVLRRRRLERPRAAPVSRMFAPGGIPPDVP